MRAMSRRDPRSLTGAIVLVAAVGAVLLAWLRPNPLADPRTVEIVFDDAAAVGPLGAEVRMAGTPVGEVKQRRREGDDAVVTAELGDEAGELHSDASAELRPRLAFEGTAFIELDPGSESAPPLAARIERERTRTYVSLDDVLRVAPADTRDAVRQTVNGLHGAFGGESPSAVNRALARGPRLLPALAAASRAGRGPGRGALTRAIRGFAVTAGEVARREHDLVPLMRDATRVAAGLDADRGAPLVAALDRLPRTLGRMRTGGAALEGIAARIRPLVSDLQPAARHLAPALRDTRPLLRELGPSLAAVRPVVADLRDGVAAGGKGADDARAAIAVTRPSIELLDESLLPALREPTALGMPAYQSFLNLFEGGGGASRPFESAGHSGPTAMGAGHFMRFGFRFLTGVGFPAPPCDLLERANADLADSLSVNGGCTP